MEKHSTCWYVEGQALSPKTDTIRRDYNFFIQDLQKILTHIITLVQENTISQDWILVTDTFQFYTCGSTMIYGMVHVEFDFDNNCVRFKTVVMEEGEI